MIDASLNIFDQPLLYMGMPGGFVVTWDDATVFHASDTGLLNKIP